MSQIHAMYPGGPMHQGDSNQNGDRTEPRLRSGEDVEAGIVASQGELKTRRKRRSMVIALGVVLAVAGMTGVYVGWQAIVTPEELMEQARTEKEASGLGGIVDDVMDELWEMERVEAVRNGR